MRLIFLENLFINFRGYLDFVTYQEISELLLKLGYYIQRNVLMSI